MTDHNDTTSRLTESDKKRFQSYISVDPETNAWLWTGGKTKYKNLGSYVDKIEAAKAYDAAARIYHGSKAKLNFPT